MLLSAPTSFLDRKFGMERALQILGQAGFDAADLTVAQTAKGFHPLLEGDLAANAAALRKMAADNGLVFNQAHAPFPTSKNDPAFNEAVFDAVVRSIRLAGAVGAKCIVVHPMHHLPYRENREKLNDMSVEFYRALAPAAREAGIRIGVENMWQRNPNHQEIIISACATRRDFTEMLDRLADDVFVACLDIGHCGLVGESPAEMARALGPRLFALHVHDNGFADDDHTIPYLGANHWDDILEALAEVGYRGDLTFEADDFYYRFDPELALPCTQFMASIGRHLISRFHAAEQRNA